MASDLMTESTQNSIQNKLTELQSIIKRLEARLKGGSSSSDGDKFIKVADPLVSEDEIQRILAQLQPYCDDVQLIGEGDRNTFSKMKWRILTEINDRLSSNQATPPRTYKATVLAVMSTFNAIGNVTLSSKEFLRSSFSIQEDKIDGGAGL